MGQHPKFCVVGQVLVDVTLTEPPSGNKLRLGGIVHAARTLWAMGIEYELAYIAPAYLSEQINVYAKKHGANAAVQIGVVSNAPNVIIVAEATEAGPQGYEYLLRDESICQLDEVVLQQMLSIGQFTDVMLFPGESDVGVLLKCFDNIGARLHIDVAYGLEALSVLSQLQRQYTTIIGSTSSRLFLEMYASDAGAFATACFEVGAEIVLLKENRGGSRLFFSNPLKKPIQIGAHLRPVVHSVGVGDCYNVAYAALNHQYDSKEALAYASLIAAEYASTTYPDDFKTSVSNALSLAPADVVLLASKPIAWERRPDVHVYLAAPDFDYVDRRPIERIVEALRYHNFTVRRPVLENGQARQGDSLARQRELFDADVALLEQCHLMVAVYLFDDAGTLIEIGLSARYMMPAVVFDPYGRANNVMLLCLPRLVSSSLDEVVMAVFEVAANL